jgi:hypothetical protein
MKEDYVDLGEMKAVVERAKTYEHPFKPWINQIVAMLLAGAKHRHVVAWANDKAGLKNERRLTNTQLCNVVAYWKKAGLIDMKKAEFLKGQILAYTEKTKPAEVKKVEPALQWVESKPEDIKPVAVIKNEEKQGVVAVNPFESL